MLTDEWKHATACAAGTCVDARRSERVIEVRDSKDPDGPILSFTKAEWLVFLDGVRAGEFDLP